MRCPTGRMSGGEQVSKVLQAHPQLWMLFPPSHPFQNTFIVIPVMVHSGIYPALGEPGGKVLFHDSPARRGIEVASVCDAERAANQVEGRVTNFEKS